MTLIHFRKIMTNTRLPTHNRYITLSYYADYAYTYIAKNDELCFLDFLDTSNVNINSNFSCGLTH